LSSNNGADVAAKVIFIECLKIPGARIDMKTAGAFQTFRKIFRSLYTQNLLEPQTKYGTS
jgi:hypothetical protein